MSLKFGDFELDRERRQLFQSGRSVPLETRAYELLDLLLSRRPRALSRSQIRDVIWPETHISESTLAGVVGSVRHALQDDAHRPRFIRTVHGFGYAFCAEVVESASGAPDSLSATREGIAERGPYPGLRSFRAEDADVFFGREEETAALWMRIQEESLGALIGPSGAGKTSLVRAGIAARPPQGWVSVVCSPAGAPAPSLARALAPALARDPGALTALPDAADPSVVASLVERWRRGHDEALIVVDQLEEIFTLCSVEEREAFVALLGRLTREANVHVLLSLRDDFLIRCHEHEELAPVFRNLTPLLPPGGAALRRALEEPARRAGFPFEDPELVDDMTRETEGARSPLPLLAFTMWHLWEKRDPDRLVLTRAAYRDIGGVAGALADHAERTLVRIGGARQHLVRDIFRRLVTAEGTRVGASRSDLLRMHGDDAATGEVLDCLIEARLLTSFEGATERGGATGDGVTRGEERVEIVHESLLFAWPRLVRWRAQDVDGAQLREQLRQATRTWEERGRPDDLLWSGTAYRELTVWRERDSVGLGENEQAFVEAAAGLAGRRRRRRRIAMSMALATMTMVALSTASLWRRATVAAGRAEAAVLVARGRLVLDEHPSAALAHALASLERADTPEGRRFALEALEGGGGTIILPVDAQTVDFSRDGRWLATGGLDGGGRLWSRGGGPPLALEGTVGIPVVRFDPGGDTLAIHDATGVHFFRPPGPHPFLEWTAERRDQYRLRASRVVTLTNRDGSSTLHVRPLATSDEVHVWPAPALEYDRWAVSPDGEWLVYSSDRDVLLRSLESETVGVRRVGRHQASVQSLTYQTDGLHVVSADDSGEIRVWSLAPTSWGSFRSIHSGLDHVARLRIDEGGRWLVAGGRSGAFDAVTVWDLDGPPDAEPVYLRNADALNTRDLSVDGSGGWVATAHNDIAVLWPLPEHRPFVLPGPSPPYPSVKFTRDGRWLLSTSRGETALRLWPLSPQVAGGGRTLLEEAGLVHLAVGPRGRSVIAASRAGQAWLVPLDGGPARALPRATESWLEEPAFSRDGRLAAAGTRQRPDGNLVEIWDLSTGAVRTLDPPTGDGACAVADPNLRGAVWDVEFTKAGQLITAGLSGLRLWNLDDGTSTLLKPCTEGYLSRLAGSSNDRFLLLELDIRQNRSIMTFFDLGAGTSRELHAHGNALASAALDPTGQVVVSGGWDGVVRVGPADESQEPHLLFGHRVEVWSVDVSPDGRSVASASEDGAVRIWPMPMGRPFHTLPYDELLERVRAATNLRLVDDPSSDTGDHVQAGPFPGWRSAPSWSEGEDGSSRIAWIRARDPR